MHLTEHLQVKSGEVIDKLRELIWLNPFYAMYLQSLIDASAKPSAGPATRGTVTRFVRLASAVPGSRPLLIGTANLLGGPWKPFPARFTVPGIAAGSPHVAKLQSLVSEKLMDPQSQILVTINGASWEDILAKFSKELPKFDINIQFIERYVAIYFAMSKQPQNLLLSIEEQLPELEEGMGGTGAKQGGILSIAVQCLTATLPVIGFLVFGEWINKGIDFLRITIE